MFDTILNFNFSAEETEEYILALFRQSINDDTFRDIIQETEGNETFVDVYGFNGGEFDQADIIARARSAEDDPVEVKDFPYIIIAGALLVMGVFIAYRKKGRKRSGRASIGSEDSADKSSEDMVRRDSAIDWNLIGATGIPPLPNFITKHNTVPATSSVRVDDEEPIMAPDYTAAVTQTYSVEDIIPTTVAEQIEMAIEKGDWRAVEELGKKRQRDTVADYDSSNAVFEFQKAPHNKQINTHAFQTFQRPPLHTYIQPATSIIKCWMKSAAYPH